MYSASTPPLARLLLSAASVPTVADAPPKEAQTSKTLPTEKIFLQASTGSTPDTPLLFSKSPTFTRRGWIGFKINPQQDHVMEISALWLVSPVGRPADTIGPFCDDRRKLGLLVGRIELWAGEKCFPLTTPLTQPDLSGWHELEAAHCRWTKKQALLPLALPAHEPNLLLGLEILGYGFKK